MFIRFVSTATLLAVVGATALAADAPARDASTRDTSTRDVPTTDSDSGTTDERLVERVTVTADRLPDEREPVEDVPASITVIDREAIERSGASTVQELLARQAGITLYDQVGNGVQTTLDLRGFTDGSGVRVFLDGAPLNDTRNNALSLELVPLDAIERVEIVRGSASALAGGGAEAGVIQLTSRAGGPFGGSFLLSSGSDAVRGLSGGVRGRSGAIDYHASATRRRSDGFRVNSGGRLTRATAGVGIDLGRDRRLEIALSGGTSDFGTPGALTVEEARADRRQAPYNEPDRKSVV